MTFRLKLVRKKIKFGDSREYPKSVCSDPCPHGYVKYYQDACCWTCVSCKDGFVSENDTCQTCGLGYTPSKKLDGCTKLKITPVNWLNPWILVPFVVSALGIMVSIFTIGVFIKFNSTPVIMASGRELCYVLLLGLIFCYSMPYVILSNPTPRLCGTMRVGVGLSLNICYSAILIKTNRICRIFNSSMRSARQPILTSPLSQIIIATLLVMFQLLGSIGWLALEKPYVKEVYPNPFTAIITCGVSPVALLASLTYNMFLIMLCTVYAFKTRKIPENFNEAKYIGFTMYSTCIVWVAFLPIYFGSNHDYTIQLVCISMCLNISASVTLGCLFSPKVYLVLLQPYKNVRQPANSQQGAAAAAGASGGPSRPGHRMRFSTPAREVIPMTTITQAVIEARPSRIETSVTAEESSDRNSSIEEQETSFN